MGPSSHDSTGRLKAGRMVFFFCLFLALAGCKAKPTGSFERTMVTQVKRKLTIGGRGEKNPFAATPENLAEGKKQFENYCTSCHGEDGRNTGVIFADKMSPPIPILTAAEVQQYKDGQLHWVIKNGIFPSGMPSWEGTLQDDEMWKIVAYIRSLPPAEPSNGTAVQQGKR